jgi:hypothetical protein
LKIEKEHLLTLIDNLDLKAEITPLDDAERKIMRDAQDELANLRRQEESKWAQRAKVKFIQEGGHNTKFFHLIANGKHRRKKIFNLNKKKEQIIGQENLKNYISEYYKQLFGPVFTNSYVMEESIIHDIR